MTSFNNPSVINSLPEVPRSGDRLFAHLIREDAEPGGTDHAFTFLANPETLEWERQAVYAEAVTAATSVQSQQYYHTKNRIWQFPDLLLETWFARRSLRPLLEKLQELLVPDPQNTAVLHPKVINFVWGSQRLGPAVLTGIRCREVAWLSNGEPASARVSLTLLEIPPPDTEIVSRLRTEEDAETLDSPLTERQQEEARAEAKKWLEANIRSLPQSLQDRVRAGRYRFLTDAATGQVQITDENGEAIATVGTWDGREFSVEDQDLEL